MSNSSNPNANTPILINFWDPSTSKPVQLSPRSNLDQAKPLFPQPSSSTFQSNSVNPINLFQAPANPNPIQFPTAKSSSSLQNPSNQALPPVFPNPNPNKNFEQDIQSLQSFIQSFELNNGTIEENLKKVNNQLELLDHYLMSSNQEIQELDQKKFELSLKLKNLEQIKETKQQEIKNFESQINQLEVKKEETKVMLGPMIRKTVDYNYLENHLEQKIKFNQEKISELKNHQNQELRELRVKYEKELTRIARKLKEEEKKLSFKENQIRKHKLKISFQKLLKNQVEARLPEPIFPDQAKPKLEFQVPVQSHFFISIEHTCLILGVLLGIILKYFF